MQSTQSMSIFFLLALVIGATIAKIETSFLEISGKTLQNKSISDFY